MLGNYSQRFFKNEGTSSELAMPNNVLRLPTACGTTIVVSELATQPPACIVAEISPEKERVSQRLRGHFLADKLYTAARELEIDETWIDFKPVESQDLSAASSKPMVSDYLLKADGTVASGVEVPAGGGYGEAAIATCQPGAFNVDATFTIAVVKIAAEYAGSIRPPQV